jgi:hypothetical protein
LFIHGAVDSAIKVVFKARYAKWREELAFKIAANELKKGRPKN